MDNATHIRIDNKGLWTLALTLITRLAGMIANLRADGPCVLDPALWRAVVRELRDVEALVRRIIVAQATLLWRTIKLKPPNPKLSIGEPPRRSGAMKAPKFCVGFGGRLLGATPQHVEPRLPVEPSYWVFRLERRIEAMRSAYADPSKLARRLARKIARHPQRLPDILMRLRRYPRHPRQRPALTAIFRMQIETFVVEAARTVSGLDPPPMLAMPAPQQPRRTRGA